MRAFINPIIKGVERRIPQHPNSFSIIFAFLESFYSKLALLKGIRNFHLEPLFCTELCLKPLLVINPNLKKHLRNCKEFESVNDQDNY